MLWGGLVVYLLVRVLPFHVGFSLDCLYVY